MVKKLKINVKSIVAMCLKLSLVPECMSEKNVQNHILAICPPLTNQEYNFFSGDKIAFIF